MSRQIFASIAVPAMIMAALLMAGSARAQPRPPGPPPMFAGGLPALPPSAPPMPRLAGPPLNAGPAGPQFRGGSFAPPANIFSGLTPPSRPNVGWSPSLPGPGPRGWKPPMVNRGSARPPANLTADQSNART
jgi:hypothetical protein